MSDSDTPNVIETVQIFMREQAWLEEGETITKTESLLERGILESLSMMELRQYLEKHYRITIDEDDLIPENFDTLLAIDEFVEKKT